VILVSLIFWGWLWGIWGMFISVPLTAVLKIMAERIEGLRPLAVLLGAGKPRIPRK
jgi:predicted PurR-regulated permease PerM